MALTDQRTVVMTEDDIVDAVELWFDRRYPNSCGDLRVELEARYLKRDVRCTLIFTPKAKP
jgi:hypothetical protein